MFLPFLISIFMMMIPMFFMNFEFLSATAFSLILISFTLSSSIEKNFYFSSMGILLVCLLFFILGLMILLSGKEMFWVLNLSTLMVLVFFLAKSLILFFIFFELSLVPLMILIISWGNQAERVKATQFMMAYTIIASFPLFFSSLYLSSEINSWDISILEFYEVSSANCFSFFLSFSILAFLVKIPCFFFHSWLPKAHVEAPLQGSMLLAGIMLKVGMFGMIRLMSLIWMSMLLKNLIMSISVFGSIYCLLTAMSSDDVKMSVAFSSISHMNIIISSIMTMMVLGKYSSSMIMISHGISSPLLFFLVTSIYNKTNSRSSVISKGVFSKVPFLAFVGLILWIVNLSTPPFLAFLGEITSFSALFKVCKEISLWIFLLMMFSSFYSVMNFSLQSHSSKKLSMKMTKEISLPTVGLMSSLLLVGMFFSNSTWL